MLLTCRSRIADLIDQDCRAPKGSESHNDESTPAEQNWQGQIGEGIPTPAGLKQAALHAQRMTCTRLAALSAVMARWLVAGAGFEGFTTEDAEEGLRRSA